MFKETHQDTNETRALGLQAGVQIWTRTDSQETMQTYRIRDEERLAYIGRQVYAD